MDREAASGMGSIEVYLEQGRKKCFAGALAWPGWCRSGRDETAALQALVDSGPRYERALDGSGLDFRAPRSHSELVVVERLEGDATTDFGAPGKAPTADLRPPDEQAAARLALVLRACWAAFDRSATAAAGRELRKGPRGGGRELEKIVEHVLEAERSYLRQVGMKVERHAGESPAEGLERCRQAALEALQAGVRGELPERGPRGGARWPAGYFARRVAWHVLDHAWEIEERVV
jgi:hypothetical protein